MMETERCRTEAMTIGWPVGNSGSMAAGSMIVTKDMRVIVMMYVVTKNKEDRAE